MMSYRLQDKMKQMLSFLIDYPRIPLNKKINRYETLWNLVLYNLTYNYLSELLMWYSTSPQYSCIWTRFHTCDCICLSWSAVLSR
jgi:hypothetical protein